MTTQPTHTPTPWGYTYDGSSDWSIGQAEDPQGMYVCNIWDRNDARAQSNAAFIVKAVNAYQPMVDALKEAQKIISTARQYFPQSVQNADRFSLENTNATIGQAIASAEDL